jgi:hypothetical protein
MYTVLPSLATAMGKRQFAVVIVIYHVKCFTTLGLSSVNWNMVGI